MITACRAAQAALWWLAGLAVLLVTALWTGAAESGLPALDRAGLALANAWRRPWLDAAFLGLTWLGSLFVLAPLASIGAVLLLRRGHGDAAAFLIAALAGAAFLAELAKQLVLRPRPDLFPALTAVASPLSFPSGHAMQAAAMAASGLALVWHLAPRWKPWAVAISLAVLLAVGLSRLYLQVHYPSDVLAGTLAAVFWVAGLRAAMPLRIGLPAKYPVAA